MPVILKKVIVLAPVILLTWLFVNARYAWEYGTVGTSVLIEPALNLLPLYLFILVDVVKRRQKSWFQILIQASFYVYIFAVLILTLYFISFREGVGNTWFENLLLRFSNKARGINLVPFTIFRDYHIFDRQILGNIVMLSPLGIYLPLLYKKASTVIRVFLIGLFTSIFIETAQLVVSVHSADIDDVILNSVGAVLGFGIYQVITNVLVYSRSIKGDRGASESDIV